ncbi:hypothetical protein L1887_35434 [Cichorium endivia]|nr:hypothetical protein L1887_35434 [Cichorium endivia]
MPPRSSTGRNVRGRTAAAPPPASRGTRRQREPSPEPVQWNARYARLSEHPQDIRPAVYDATHPETRMQVERTVDRDSFRGFHITEAFDEYGWAGVLDFDTRAVHTDLVREWMRTLRRQENGGGENVQLIGSIRGEPIIMTVPRIRDYFSVDTGVHLLQAMGEPTLYACVDTRNPGNLVDMARLVDTVYTRGGTNAHQDLVPRAKALMRIIEYNVNPRASDKGKVPAQDAIIIYALMTGEVQISFAYNAICNIWWSYDTRYRNTTPHVCLISSYLVRELGARIRAFPPPRSFENVLTTALSQYKSISFIRQNGRCIIRDLDNHTEYECPGVAGGQGPAPADDGTRQSQGHHRGEGTSGASSWDQRAAWDAESLLHEERYASLTNDIADLNALVGRIQLISEDTRAISATHFHAHEYYTHASYQGSRPDPMDIDQPQQPHYPAPLYWRAGEPAGYPPPSEYQDYRPPASTTYRDGFESLAESIFGVAPPYPRYPPPPPQ